MPKLKVKSKIEKKKTSIFGLHKFSLNGACRSRTERLGPGASGGACPVGESGRISRLSVAESSSSFKLSGCGVPGIPRGVLARTGVANGDCKPLAGVSGSCRRGSKETEGVEKTSSELGGGALRSWSRCRRHVLRFSPATS